jgi:hypothetical protein
MNTGSVLTRLVPHAIRTAFDRYDDRQTSGGVVSEFIERSMPWSREPIPMPSRLRWALWALILVEFAWGIWLATIVREPLSGVNLYGRYPPPSRRSAPSLRRFLYRRSAWTDPHHTWLLEVQWHRSDLSGPRLSCWRRLVTRSRSTDDRRSDHLDRCHDFRSCSHRDTSKGDR